MLFYFVSIALGSLQMRSLCFFYTEKEALCLSFVFELIYYLVDLASGVFYLASEFLRADT